MIENSLHYDEFHQSDYKNVHFLTLSWRDKSRKALTQNRLKSTIRVFWTLSQKPLGVVMRMNRRLNMPHRQPQTS